VRQNRKTQGRLSFLRLVKNAFKRVGIVWLFARHCSIKLVGGNMFTDPIGDMIARIRNVQMRGRKEVRVPHSRIKTEILDALLREGYIAGYKVGNLSPAKKELIVSIKYSPNNRPVIQHMARSSKPSLHVYKSFRDLGRARFSLAGVQILTTSQGVMSDREAKIAGVGGQVLMEVR
jgi:small subunit ribosomal protein S8